MRSRTHTRGEGLFRHLWTKHTYVWTKHTYAGALNARGALGALGCVSSLS